MFTESTYDATASANINFGASSLWLILSHARLPANNVPGTL